MRVELIYRNYKPLHKAYESLVNNPPRGVEYVVSPTKARLQKFYPLYKRLRYFAPTRNLIRLVEQVIFTKASNQDEPVDLYQYINLIDERRPDRPYVVDTEHAAGLISFAPDHKRVKKVIDFLQPEQCVGISCWSQAAQKSLKNLTGSSYSKFSKKVEVIYPALPSYAKLYPKADFSIIPKNNKLKVLFVGNQAYLKGLEELLKATEELNEKFGPDRLAIYVVSDDGAEVVQKYALPNVELFAPKFSKQDVITKLYMPADVFVMPTKQDTFGLALLDALSCGTAAIATKQFAAAELIEDGVDGCLLDLDNPMMDTVLVPQKADTERVAKPSLDQKLADQIVSVITNILDGRLDIKKMGQNGVKKFQPGGKFSVSTRNKKLLEVYDHSNPKR